MKEYTKEEVNEYLFSKTTQYDKTSVREVLKVKRLTDTNLPLPTYATKGSSGMDLRADILGRTKAIYHIHSDDRIILSKGDRVVIPAGIAVEIPEGFEIQIRPRSGLAYQYGITVINTPGTIDSDYRGEIGATLVNHGSGPFVIKHGDRIAQMVIQRVEQLPIEEVEVLSDTSRGSGGFGSTGSK